MQTARFRSDDWTGLLLAVFLHLALLAALMAQMLFKPTQAITAPGRVTVSLAEDVGLEATAPVPVADSRLGMAPEVGEETDPVPSYAPPDKPTAQPAAQPRTQIRKPPSQSQAPRRRPDRPTSKPSATNKPRTSNVDDDFMKGLGANPDSSQNGAPARAFGPREQAALSQAINRQLKPHWRAPQGADAERLVTILRWRLNKDGSLAGAPVVVSQSGINDANRAQAEVHAERAIRAVQLAAPFKLPNEFYDKWSYIREWRFDRRL